MTRYSARYFARRTTTDYYARHTMTFTFYSRNTKYVVTTLRRYINRIITLLRRVAARGMPTVNKLAYSGIFVASRCLFYCLELFYNVSQMSRRQSQKMTITNRKVLFLVIFGKTGRRIVKWLIHEYEMS